MRRDFRLIETFRQLWIDVVRITQKICSAPTSSAVNSPRASLFSAQNWSDSSSSSQMLEGCGRKGMWRKSYIQQHRAVTKNLMEHKVWIRDSGRTIFVDAGRNGRRFNFRNYENTNSVISAFRRKLPLKWVHYYESSLSLICNIQYTYQETIITLAIKFVRRKRFSKCQNYSELFQHHFLISLGSTLRPIRLPWS